MLGCLELRALMCIVSKRDRQYKIFCAAIDSVILKLSQRIFKFTFVKSPTLKTH